MNSWKTTVCGFIAAAIAILTAVLAAMDNDPSTVPNWELVAASCFAAWGLFMARDNDKTSEQVKAGGRKTTDFIKPNLILLALVPLVLVGCQGPAASEDRGAMGYVAPAIDIDFNLDGVDRQSQPHVPLDENGEPEATVDAIEELLEGEDATALQAKRAAGQAGGSGGNVIYIREFHVSVSGGNEAASRDSGGQNAEGARLNASIPVQANTGGAAGTQGDTTTSATEATTDTTATASEANSDESQ